MLVIDRFEKKFAVCEDEEKGIVNIPKYKLPLNCKEGDIIELDERDFYVVAAEKTEEKRQEMQDRLGKLFK